MHLDGQCYCTILRIKSETKDKTRESREQQLLYCAIIPTDNTIFSGCAIYEGYFFFKVRSVAKLEPQWESDEALHNASSMPVNWQFWANSEPVNMPITIETPVKCGVRAVIWFLYSEKATRNVVLRYCPSSWQCSAAYCSSNKDAPEAFSMRSVWSPTIIRPDLAPCDFHLFPCMKRSEEDKHFGTLSCRPA